MSVTASRSSPSRLIIVSVPLVRIARVTLSDHVLGSLRTRYNVVVVAPFADDPGFVTSFTGINTSFVKWKQPELTRLQRMLYAASEIMRVHGYWLRHREHATGYFVHNRFREFGENGRDTRLSRNRRTLYRVLALLGRTGRWRAVDRLLGTRWGEQPELVELARRYENVTLIQSANWGMQDRTLATLARREGWRSVLVPYTTDQLDINGFLLNEFDIVCPQGPFEYERAMSLHSIPPSRLRRLGSAWFRHLRQIRSSVTMEQHARDATPSIIYAGVSSLYFPRACEYAALDAVADFVARRYPDYRLIYRPVELSPSGRAEIEAKYGSNAHVELQWPSVSEIGLGEYERIDHEAALRSYVQSLSGCRLMIMSNATSLCMDAAFLEGCGIICNRADPTGVLRDRNTESLDRSWHSALRIAGTLPELISQMEFLLQNSAQAAAEAEALVSRWDYPEADFDSMLQEAVEGEPVIAIPHGNP